MYGPDGRSKGCGIVEFEKAAEAQNAMATLHDSELKGRLMFVREDRGTQRGGAHNNQFAGNMNNMNMGMAAPPMGGAYCAPLRER
jgi:RNA recognition motif-containing protein